MATKTDSEEKSRIETKISCGSKRSLDVVNETIFSAVNDVIGKNTAWSEDQRERLQRRFQEVYETAVHENIDFDGHTWADVEAHEEEECTREFEAVNLEKQNAVQEMAGDLDTLIVDTTAKRKHFPRKITQQVAVKLQCQHVASENYKPLLVSSIGECSQSVINTEDAESLSDRLTSCGETISTLSKDLPMLEDKATRLHDAINMQNSTSKTTTHNIISKPDPEEDKMATSITPLQKRLDETPSASVDNKIAKRQLPKKELRDHPIKRYKLRTPTNS